MHVTVALLATRQLKRAAATDDQMKDADVAQMGHWRTFVPPLRTDHPKRRGKGAAKENRPAQAHSPQHFRQHVRATRAGRPGRRIGK